MTDHGSSENDMKLADGQLDFRELHTVLNETVAGFALLYIYDVSNVPFLLGLTGRPIHNLEDLKCPPPYAFNHRRWCTLPCHKFPKFPYSTKTAKSVYD